MTSALRASPIPSSDALRRAALARSARRGARVAFWRLGFRWLLWALGWGLVALGAVTVLAVLLWSLWRASAPWRQATPPPPLPAPALPAATPPPAAPAARYPLRMDDSEPLLTPGAAAQSRPASSPPQATP
jgi:hypothetical protein